MRGIGKKAGTRHGRDTHLLNQVTHQCNIVRKPKTLNVGLDVISSVRAKSSEAGFIEHS